jgi:hypothetical protein
LIGIVIKKEDFNRRLLVYCRSESMAKWRPTISRGFCHCSVSAIIKNAATL